MAFREVCKSKTSVRGVRLVDLNYKKRFCDVPMQPVPCRLVVLLDRITRPALKQKLPVSDDEINHHHRSLRSHVAKCFAPGRGGDFFFVSCTSGKTKQNKNIVISGLVLRKTFQNDTDLIKSNQIKERTSFLTRNLCEAASKIMTASGAHSARWKTQGRSFLVRGARSSITRKI